VTGHGLVGEALVAHDGVDHVTFVGSAAVGRAVAHACAERLVPVQLELGGKSPQIVFADADLERAAPAIVKALLQNAGQSCSAGSRLLVEAGIHDELVERVGRAMGEAEVGPLISERQMERALGMLERAGGAIVRGGSRTGLTLEPTIVTGVRPGTELFEEEVFGPVLSVAAFEDEAAAVELANATPYGLVAAVWTRDAARAHRVAGAVQAGQVYINGYGVAGGVELPFGGMKRSGYGRGKGMEAMRSYTQVKNVCVIL
jgi:aldehyde dehydrogenase (NAD+)/betaine-aldehyde dehydrogenase